MPRVQLCRYKKRRRLTWDSDETASLVKKNSKRRINEGPPSSLQVACQAPIQLISEKRRTPLGGQRNSGRISKIDTQLRRGTKRIPHKRTPVMKKNIINSSSKYIQKGIIEIRSSTRAHPQSKRETRLQNRSHSKLSGTPEINRSDCTPSPKKHKNTLKSTNIVTNSRNKGDEEKGTARGNPTIGLKPRSLNKSFQDDNSVNSDGSSRIVRDDSGGCIEIKKHMEDVEAMDWTKAEEELSTEIELPTVEGGRREQIKPIEKVHTLCCADFSSCVIITAIEWILERECFDGNILWIGIRGQRIQFEKPDEDSQQLARMIGMKISEYIPQRNKWYGEKTNMNYNPMQNTTALVRHIDDRGDDSSMQNSSAEAGQVSDRIVDITEENLPQRNNLYSENTNMSFTQTQNSIALVGNIEDRGDNTPTQNSRVLVGQLSDREDDIFEFNESSIQFPTLIRIGQLSSTNTNSTPVVDPSQTQKQIKGDSYKYQTSLEKAITKYKGDKTNQKSKKETNKKGNTLRHSQGLRDDTQESQKNDPDEISITTTLGDGGLESDESNRQEDNIDIDPPFKEITIKRNIVDTEAADLDSKKIADMEWETSEIKDEHYSEEESQSELENSSDLEGYQKTEVDKELQRVYGDYVHKNLGTHLDGGVRDDADWQRRWRALVVWPSRRFEVPKGAVGHKYVAQITKELSGIMNRTWNSERFLVFQMVILQRSPKVVSATAIRNRIKSRLQLWMNGEFEWLVHDTVTEMKTIRYNQSHHQTQEQVAKVYSRLLLQGKVRAAVRWLTERANGGLLMPDDMDEQKHQPVHRTLCDLHPEARSIVKSDLEVRVGRTPVMPHLEIERLVVEKISHRLSGSAGLGGTDSNSLQRMMSNFGQTSRALQTQFALMTSWLANTTAPWAAYRGLVAGRLVAVDKQPGVRPVGIGESWRRMMGKIVIHLTSGEAARSCKENQLCAGLSAGIEGGIHSAVDLLKEHYEEEEWGFLLVDASNAFNSVNREKMLWTARFEWPTGARFLFNMYKHWSTLVIRGKKESFHIESKEGVTQGDPLAMIGFGLSTLPLIRSLGEEHSEAYQSWYADDAGIGGNYKVIRLIYKSLVERGLSLGYAPEASKSRLITNATNIPRAQEYFADLGFTVKTGDRYLGGYLGDDVSKKEWVSNKVKDWKCMIDKMSNICHRCPQEIFIGLTLSLQSEWTFMQRVMKSDPEWFQELETTLTERFIPKLFDVEPPDRNVTTLPVRLGGMGIRNPVTDSTKHYSRSRILTAHLIQCLKGEEDFDFNVHMASVRAYRREWKEEDDAEGKRELEVMMAEAPDESQRQQLVRGNHNGAWLTVKPTVNNGTDLAPQEFRDGLAIRFGKHPRDLPDICDGCGIKTSMSHALNCRSGGLIIARHNEIKDELGYLSASALAPNAIRNEPLIHSGPCEQGVRGEDEVTEERGDLLLRGIEKVGIATIVDVRVINTLSKSYCNRSVLSVIEQAEKEKEKKYGDACRARRRSFVPFIFTVDGMLGYEADQLLKLIAKKLAKKWHDHYSKTCGFVRSRMGIAMVRAAHRCLRGSRVPMRLMSSFRPQWEDGSGFRNI